MQILVVDDSSVYLKMVVAALEKDKMEEDRVLAVYSEVNRPPIPIQTVH